MHDELQKLNKEELIQIINEKTDYLSMIVHQLRTPLTAEKWFLEMLYTGNLDILNLSEKKNLIKKAQENIEDSLKLLGELSAANHTHQWKLLFSPKQTSLDQLLEKSVQVFTGEAMMKHVSMVLHLDKEKKYPIMADSDKMFIVFQNIIENAIKYSLPGNCVDISIETLSESFIVTVTDRGIGIPFDEQKNIFTKLYRASNASSFTTGTGLGLYIAREICRYHHGDIWFESIPDIGTTFFIKIPTYVENNNNY